MSAHTIDARRDLRENIEQPRVARSKSADGLAAVQQPGSRDGLLGMLNVLVFLLAIVSAAVFAISGQAPWFLTVPALALISGMIVVGKIDENRN